MNGGAELTARTPLTAAPYSLNARSVLGGSNVFPSSGNVGIGTSTPGSKLTIVGPPDTFQNWEGVLSIQSSERGYGSGDPVSFTANDDMEGNTAFLGIGSSVPQTGGGGQPFIIFELPTGSDVPVIFLDQHGTGPFLVCGNPAAPPTLDY